MGSDRHVRTGHNILMLTDPSRRVYKHVIPLAKEVICMRDTVTLRLKWA